MKRDYFKTIGQVWRRVVVVVALIVATLPALAQNITVTGTVVDRNDNAPVVGASVRAEGSKFGTITDSEGHFRLVLPKKYKYLLISYLGKKSCRCEATENVRVVLDDDTNTLSDVIVSVAYGEQNKRNLTGAVASVGHDALLTTPVTSIDQALQGKATGVQVTNATGQPGGAVVVNIRGTSSISAGNDPLYVVDGMPILSQDLTLKGGYQGNGISGVADLNPSDIESIEVLKDASAAALYGSRASNGVILITTRRGHQGKTKVTLDSYIGAQTLGHRIDLLNATDYVNARNEAIDNYNTSLALTPADAAYKQHVSAVNEGADTDWIDEVTRTGLQTSHQLAVSGGDAKTRFFISGGYYDQQGIIKRTDYKRWNLRENVSRDINHAITLESDIALSASKDSRTTGDGNIYSPWQNALQASPDRAIYDADGNYNDVNSGLYNPVNLFENQEQTTKKYRALVNLRGTWKIIQGLRYQIHFGGDYNILHDYGIFPENSIEGATEKGEVTDRRGFSFSNLIEHTLDYTKLWGDLTFKALLGYSYQHTKLDDNGVTGIGFVSTALKYIDSASTISYGSSSLSEYALQSVFGRVNLSYLDRYLLEVSLRRDQSSKFSKDNRTGYFPAASLGWRLSDEKWFPRTPAVNDLKLRGSFGYTGNQEGIGYYNYFETYTTSYIKYNGVSGLAFPYDKPNTDLTWEKTIQWDLGLDATLFDHRLDLTFDWYLKNTHDLLLTHSINALSGYSSMTSNVGSMRNTGVDLGITSHNFRGAFVWNTTLNFSWTKNKITQLTDGTDVIETGYSNVLQVGEPMCTYYLIRMDGIFQSKEEILAQPGGQALWDKGIRPGDVKYYDKDQNGVINDADRVLCGTPYPKVTGALINTFSYKGFDLNIDLQYSLGNKLYAWWKHASYGLGNQGGNVNGYAIAKEEWDNRWTEDNPSGSAPRAVAAGAAYTNNTKSYTTRYLEDADFLRIRNITLGYTLPEALTSKVGISRLRLYFTANNIHTFTGYDGFDPETVMFPSRSVYRGWDMASVPQPRSYIFGLNVAF